MNETFGISAVHFYFSSSRRNNRFDLRLKSGELPPGEERGVIEITTQWFYNPMAASATYKKGDSDTEV